MNVDLLGEAKRRLEAGHPASARDLAEQALDAARASHSGAGIARAAQLLGECLYVVGDVDGAGELGREARGLDEERGDAAALGADLNLLGVVALTTGQMDEGRALFRRSLDLREEALGPDHEETIESLNNLGVAMWSSGAQDEASPCMRTHCDGASGRWGRRIDAPPRP